MTDLPRVLALLWRRDEPGRRGPKPRHTINDIGAAAVAIADADGLDAVSMARVAQHVGLTTMALYRYVDSKDDLILAMVNEAYGMPPPARRSNAGWRTKLARWATANRDALRRHPWIVQIPINEPPLAPAPLRWMERGLAAFDGTALTQQDRLSSLLLAEVYVRGQTQLSSQLAATDPAAARAADELYGRRLGELLDEDEFPFVSTALGSGSLTDSGGDFADDEFLFGLQTVLDGIAALVERREAGHRQRQ